MIVLIVQNTADCYLETPNQQTNRNNNMKKLIEALHTIQNECNKYEKADCEDCPLYVCGGCAVQDTDPSSWKINDEVQKALL